MHNAVKSLLSINPHYTHVYILIFLLSSNISFDIIDPYNFYFQGDIVFTLLPIISDLPDV
jgi:hypothetical protein